jgi:AcrR family transcriptional regulator
VGAAQTQGGMEPRQTKRAAPLSHNLNGQRLGRKGRDTRDRIIAVAQEILEDPGGSPITLSEVARRAAIRMGTLYLYFADLTELMIALLEPVIATTEDEYVRLIRMRWSDTELGQRTFDFVTAYHGFWVKHSRLLHLRNSMSDRQDERMMLQRVRATQPLMGLLVEQMDGDLTKPGTPVFSMATALMTGLERVVTVTTDTNLQDLLHTRFSATHAHLLTAEARLLELGIRDTRAKQGL